MGCDPCEVPRIGTVDDFFKIGEDAAVSICNLNPGDLVVLVAGLPIGVQGGTNLLRVLSIPS